MNTLREVKCNVANVMKDSTKDKGHRTPYINERGLFCVLTKTNNVMSTRFIKEYFNTISPRIREHREQTTLTIVVIEPTVKLVKLFNIENIENYINSVHGHICIYEDKVEVPYENITSYKLLYTKNINNRILTYKCGKYSYNMICYIPIIWSPFTDIVKQRFREKQLKKYVTSVGYSTLKELKTDIIHRLDEFRYLTCHCIICPLTYKLNGLERHKHSLF